MLPHRATVATEFCREFFWVGVARCRGTPMSKAVGCFSQTDMTGVFVMKVPKRTKKVGRACGLDGKMRQSLY